MLKKIILLILIVSVSCGCPHSLSKRQVGGRPGRGGNGGDGRNDNNNDDLPPPDNHLRPPPPDDQGKGDKRPHPTEPIVPVSTNDCDANSKYYSPDGQCNNLRNPNWGRAGTTFKRFLDPVYADGKSTPRTTSVFGQPLPNPRLISRNLMVDNSEFEAIYSDLLVYFGQWQAHDFAEIIDTKRNDEFVDCPCGSTDPDCLSYIRPPTDTGVTQDCFTFTRTGSVTRFNVRQQENHLSSYVDATQVYGKTKTVQDELRTFRDGLMLTSEENYLPRSESDFTCSDEFDLPCFVGGEDRASENLALTTVHTLFLREHNRLAGLLKARHRNWNDEQLYQEARRINIAQIQNIVYNEWLPTVIGSRANEYDIKPKTSGYSNSYNQNIDPSTANEFGVAAFRFGHTLIRNSIDRYNLLHMDVNAPLNLSEIIFNTEQSYNTAYGLGGLEAIFMGLLEQPTSKFDGSIVDTLQNHLFEFEDENGDITALDLAATNINRGRDHAVPSYTKYIEMCDGREVNTWTGLAGYMTPENIAKLRSVYASARDVDLFVGGIHETPVSGGVVGPTFGCIIGKQFQDFKHGDRLYFEHGPSTTSFSTNQLDEIRKVSMSSLICNNYGLQNIQPYAFYMPYNWLGNGRVSCNNIQKLNINLF